MPVARGQKGDAGGNADRAVVVTCTLAVFAFVPSGMTEAGDTVHAASAGAPVQLSKTP